MEHLEGLEECMSALKTEELAQAYRIQDWPYSKEAHRKEESRRIKAEFKALGLQSKEKDYLTPEQLQAQLNASKI